MNHFIYAYSIIIHYRCELNCKNTVILALILLVGENTIIKYHEGQVCTS